MGCQNQSDCPYQLVWPVRSGSSFPEVIILSSNSKSDVLYIYFYGFNERYVMVKLNLNFDKVTQKWYGRFMHTSQTSLHSGICFDHQQIARVLSYKLECSNHVIWKSLLSLPQLLQNSIFTSSTAKSSIQPPPISKPFVLTPGRFTSGFICFNRFFFLISFFTQLRQQTWFKKYKIGIMVEESMKNLIYIV